MLLQLSIRNFALIERADISFNSGFTAITGETGSGKSILLGALNLILGERADYSVIRDENQKTIVEAQFLLSPSFKLWFESNDIDWEDNTVVRREITAQGKSRAFINDTPVQLTILKDLTEQLIYIHSQHQTLSIRQPQFQFDLLDAFGDLSDLSESYKTNYSIYKSVQTELKNLVSFNAQSEKEADFMRFQLDELMQLDLHKNDFKSYEVELKRLSQLDDLKFAFDGYSSGIDSENGPLDRLRILKSTTDKWKNLDPVLEDFATRLQAVLIELADLSNEAANQLEQLESDPERVLELTHLVDRFNTLLRKHQVNSQEELIEIEKDLSQKLENIDSADERIEALKVKSETIQKELKILSDSWYTKRLDSAEKLRTHLKSMLADLKLSDTDLKFELSQLDELDANGGMSIQFLFSANKGMDLKSIEKAASGGELSRLMLAIQATMSVKKSLPTLILDEIDSGVSGEVGLRVGKMLQRMGENLQLFAITHLPQVAALGQHHFEVSKSTTNSVTNSKISILSKEERVEAIARLISGDVITESAKINALSLMN